MQEVDCLVIGSGFGGAVSALRMVEKGHSVVVLERGGACGAPTSRQVGAVCVA